MNAQNNKVFILNHILSVKVTKLLVEKSQFEFLVMTERNIFVYKLFLLLNISDFLFTFFCKIAPPPPPSKKVTSLFSSNPLLKVEVLSSPPPFWKFGRRFNLPQQKGGRGAHYVMWTHIWQKSHKITLSLSVTFLGHSLLGNIGFPLLILLLFLEFILVSLKLKQKTRKKNY